MQIKCKKTTSITKGLRFKIHATIENSIDHKRFCIQNPFNDRKLYQSLKVLDSKYMKWKELLAIKINFNRCSDVLHISCHKTIVNRKHMYWLKNHVTSYFSRNNSDYRYGFPGVPVLRTRPCIKIACDHRSDEIEEVKRQDERRNWRFSIIAILERISPLQRETLRTLLLRHEKARFSILTKLQTMWAPTCHQFGTEAKFSWSYMAFVYLRKGSLTRCISTHC